MNNDNRNHFKSLLISLIGVLVSIFTMFSSFFLLSEKSTDRNNIYIYIFLGICSAIILNLLTTLLTRIRDKYHEYNSDDKNLTSLSKLISYNKKRDEIEQEIKLLTRELMNSDISQYIDVNRLAFSGQSSNLMYGSINYDNFLTQFGLKKDAITIKENSAAFLTPFNEEGTMLFKTCQSILGSINIFLRKTDNFVEKDDILMNIVSLIVQSELVLVNIDGKNPNVYYELGIAHALGKPTILLSKAQYKTNDIGFDIRQKRIIIYENERELETELLSQISMLRKNLSQKQ